MKLGNYIAFGIGTEFLPLFEGTALGSASVLVVHVPSSKNIWEDLSKNEGRNATIHVIAPYLFTPVARGGFEGFGRTPP